ncbi:hypothetical protein MXD63_20565 [Frankia sp. Cpl3]|uniref:hypothetical protein n=1 Tax=Parafrankia colletiae TaxID=573497 RepID=UPI000A647D70|nr:hypothetical protein [Parafrankia colletiae]MCK9902461.1 hypothetical protein [Frankia sp. Cpl3]
MDAVSAALDAVATVFPEERREHARQRQAVIDANPALQERELLKLASLAAATAAALRQRGVADPDASLAGEAAMVVFRIAFARWIAEFPRGPARSEAPPAGSTPSASPGPVHSSAGAATGNPGVRDGHDDRDDRGARDGRDGQGRHGGDDD